MYALDHVFSSVGGVWLFLILSGYGIGTGFFQKKYLLTGQDGKVQIKRIIRFYIGRLLKIAPFYYLYCLLFEVFSGQFFFWQNPVISFQMLTFTFNGNGGINGLGHLWYLSMAMQLYVFMPLLYIGIEFLCKTGKAFVFLSIAVIFSGMVMRVALYQAGRDWYSEIYTNCLVNLDLVAAGMLTAKAVSSGVIVIKEHEKETIKIIGVAVFSGLILYNCYIYAAGTETGFFVYRCILPSAYIVICMLLLSASTGRKHGTDTKIIRKIEMAVACTVRWFSKCSFVFYVFHISVLDYLSKSLAATRWFLNMHPNWQYFLFFAVSLVILLPLSAVFTRWNAELVRYLKKMIRFDTG
ncbi:MAG: acyltransferase family protein [Eubacterium sp.]|nr:acyltransferase family protein [Eubacterium sp.]